MQLAALISNTIFATFLINLCLIQPSEATACDVPWIRFMYMLSCGRRKRESVPIDNDNFSEPIPTDIYAAIEYYKERDPYNPLFNENIDLLNEILYEDEGLLQKEMIKYGRLYPKALRWRLWKIMEEKQIEESILLNKLFHVPSRRKHFGIRGFPEQWNVNELIEQKANKNYRRQIDRLMEQCCKTNQENTCNEETFRGAC